MKNKCNCWFQAITIGLFYFSAEIFIDNYSTITAFLSSLPLKDTLIVSLSILSVSYTTMRGIVMSRTNKRLRQYVHEAQDHASAAQDITEQVLDRNEKLDNILDDFLGSNK